MNRFVVALMLALLLGCAPIAGPGAATPPPIPSPGDHLATAPVGPPPLTGNVPPLDVVPTLPPQLPGSPAPVAGSGVPVAEDSTQHGGWAPHGPPGAICWGYGLNLVSSMVRWPGYVGSFVVTTGGSSKTYLAEYLWYQGWIGWRDTSGQVQYRPGVALGAYDELDSGEYATFAWLDNGWRPTSIIANTYSGYYGYGSNVTIPASGSFWTWIYYSWGPIREGTPERPGAQVFTGGGHLDYVGSYQC